MELLFDQEGDLYTVLNTCLEAHILLVNPYSQEATSRIDAIYHTDLDVQTMPEYVFPHNRKDHGLYNLFYQYLIQRWDNPEIPEYDFDTEELVYRGHNGTVVIAQQFGIGKEAEALRQEQGVRS
jgi:hypothetical protein